MRTKFMVIAGAMRRLSHCFGTAASLAHHAFAAEFDANRPVNLRGKVTRVEWINPHAWIHIDNVNADGTMTAWMVEGGTPNTLLRRGITKDYAEDRHRDRRARLSVEGRAVHAEVPRQRPRRDLP